MNKRKWVINKNTIEDVVREILSVNFDKVDQVKFDKSSFVLSYQVQKHIKTLPVKLQTLFADKAIPIPLSASLFVLFIQSAVISTVTGFIGVIIGLTMTQRFMSSSLERGTVELWLSKPISRTGFMLSRFIGSNFLILIVALLLVIPFELGLWLQTGIYTFGFFLAIPIFLFYFSCLYSVVVLLTIFLRRSTVGIAVFLWIACSLVYFGYSQVKDNPQSGSPTVNTLFETAYNVLPKLSEISIYSTKALTVGTNIVQSDLNMFLNRMDAVNINTIPFVFGTSAVFTAVFLFLASWIFSKKSY